MNQFAKWAAVLSCLTAILLLNGGHWLALQGVAWGRMMLEFSQQDSIGAAVVKTFDGRHPCSLCKKVSKGWQQEQRQQQTSTWSLLKTNKVPELFWETGGALLPLAALTLEPPPWPPGFYTDFIDAPSSPPPRS